MTHKNIPFQSPAHVLTEIRNSAVEDAASCIVLEMSRKFRDNPERLGKHYVQEKRYMDESHYPDYLEESIRIMRWKICTEAEDQLRSGRSIAESVKKVDQIQLTADDCKQAHFAALNREIKRDRNSTSNQSPTQTRICQYMD